MRRSCTAATSRRGVGTSERRKSDHAGGRSWGGRDSGSPAQATTKLAAARPATA